MTDFEKVQYVRQCCFSILPQLYCDRFSITEQIGKIVNALNKLIENNNKLEDYVKEIIREVIESGEIEEIIKDMLANYILNVKFPPEGIEPASGDGTKDDTLAIQGCIDYANANGGKAIYFPSGKYLTQSLTLKNNVSLFGFDMTTTHIVLKGGSINALITGTSFNNQFTGLTFDGNADIQVNNVNLIDITGGNFTFNNLTLTDGYNLLHINLENDVEINNVIFNYGVENLLITNGEGKLNCNNLIFKELSVLKGKYAIDNKVNNSSFTNINSFCNTETAIKNTANNCVFIGKILNATNTHENNGTNNYYDFYNRGGNTQDKINELNQKIETEKNDRIQNDDILNTKILEETNARIENDNLLDTKISEETELRIENDNLLKNDIILSKNYINVKEYGAKGDGINNDTVSIQTALNESKYIFIPEGTYLVDQIIFPSYCVIYGAQEDKVVFKANSNIPVFKSLNFNSLTGTDSSGGVSGFVIKNISIDCNNTAPRGIAVYGYRFIIDTVSIYNATEVALYTEWGKALGAGADGGLMESNINFVRLHHSARGLLFKGPHDSYINDMLIYLCDYGAAFLGTSVNTIDGTTINGAHVYAIKNNGIYCNGALTFNNCSSETCGYNNTNVSEAYGFIHEGGYGRYNNILSFYNKNSGLLISGANNVVTGIFINNPTMVEIGSDGGNNDIRLNCQSSEGQTLLKGTPTMSSTSRWYLDDGTSFIRHNRQTGRIGVPVPANIGEGSASINTLYYPMLVYYIGGSGCKVKHLGETLDLNTVNTFILEPGAKVWFDTSVPTSWVWQPFLS